MAQPAEPPWYGPVCPVVWEGRHREVSPYPDQDSPAAFFFDQGSSDDRCRDSIPIPCPSETTPVLAYAEEHGLKPAARHFALSRTTVRQWRDRRDAQGPAGLLPQYPKRRRRRVAPELIPLVKQARLEHRFGADRTRIWLQRVHGISIAAQNHPATVP
jgi:hypothetical protein